MLVHRVYIVVFPGKIKYMYVFNECALHQFCSLNAIKCRYMIYLYVFINALYSDQLRL